MGHECDTPILETLSGEGTLYNTVGIFYQSVLVRPSELEAKDIKQPVTKG